MLHVAAAPLRGCVAGMWHVAAEAWLKAKSSSDTFIFIATRINYAPPLGVCRIWKFINDLANAFPSDPTEEVVATREC